jgi:hypothetical protein
VAASSQPTRHTQYSSHWYHSQQNLDALTTPVPPASCSRFDALSSREEIEHDRGQRPQHSKGNTAAGPCCVHVPRGLHIFNPWTSQVDNSLFGAQLAMSCRVIASVTDTRLSVAEVNLRAGVRASRVHGLPVRTSNRPQNSLRYVQCRNCRQDQQQRAEMRMLTTWS